MSVNQKVKIIIRFYEELNDLIPQKMRKQDIDFSFNGRRSVKDLIESFGVPHVEVDLILVNGKSVDFSYIVRDNDRISVYPVFELLNLKDANKLRPSPLRDTKFVIDVHLRKLARRLRLLGFDVDYADMRDDKELAEISERDSRILLTRDRQLLMRRNVSRGIIIRDSNPDKQIIEVLNRFDIWERIDTFSRCIECNGKITSLPTDGIRFDERKDYIPAGVLDWCSIFYECTECEKIYWKGSHYEKLGSILQDIMKHQKI